MTVNLKLPARTPDAPLPRGVTRPTWVVVELSGSYPARQPGSPVAALLNRQETLEALSARLERLGKADWLHGVLIRFGEYSGGLATSRAIADRLKALSAHKRTVAWLPQVSMPALLAASGAQEVAAPESAEVNVLGLGAEVTYLGEALKKRGIAFENLRIKEYKSALTRFSDDHMDDYNREQLLALLDDFERQWVRDLAAARGVDEAAARGWLEHPPTSAQGARSAGMLSRVCYEDELIGPGTRPLAAVIDLLRPAGGNRRKKEGRIAVVPVVGAIVTGKSRNNPLPIFGGVSAGSETVVAALKRAEADDATKAIILFVNSGGGSALASDLIWRQVQQSKKPVVAVMGEVAASGGYYVLTHARRVIASPYTVTGSIGVVSGKPVLEEFNQRQGLNPEAVTRHELARMYSGAHKFSDAQRQHLQTGIEEVYGRFTARVAEGRGLSQERVNELGRGRIWSGVAALEHGLIDELGDLHTAAERACELAGISYGAPLWNAAPANRGPFPEFAQAALDDAASLSLSLPRLGLSGTLLLMDHEITAG